MGSIAMEEYELMRDSKYRVYVSAVDKALKIFEYSTEWADLISALGKLNKVLLSNAKFPVIPRRIKISKRLAQCMHPALPFGVHLKALETYDIIFKSMGTNRLSYELFIYSAGLFPLFGHAAMKVRPFLLDIYENHFVPLGQKLRPALPGFLSGVLSGLEENSDHYTRTNRMLEQVCEDVGPSHFYGCLWDCLACNSAVRLPAISFIISHFDRKLSTEDQAHIMGTNIETMVVGLMGCVEDSCVLVQRSALDLLLVGFPMHNSHLTLDDMVRLVTASLSTVLRRDMSLNRRLYAWLLGSEVNMTVLSHHPHMRKAKAESRSTTYFDVFSRTMLVEGINIVLDNAIGQTPHDLRPYKLLRTLLDKVEIGSVILDDILFQVFRLLYLSYQQKCDNFNDLIKSANMLLSSLEANYIWSYLGELISSSAKQQDTACYHDDNENPVKRVSSTLKPSITEVCAVGELLLDVVSLESWEETPSMHLPALFLHIVTVLGENIEVLTCREAANSLKFCAKLLTRVQPAVVAAVRANTMPASLLRSCLVKYEKFYVTVVYWTRLRGGETASVSELLDSLRQLSCTSSHNIKAEVIPSEELANWVEPLRIASRLLVDLSTLRTFFHSSSEAAPNLEPNIIETESSCNELLPEWLRVLIVSACCLRSSDSIRFVAISTLLNLVTLCRTAESLVPSTTESGATPVLIVPLLTPVHLNYLHKHTFVFQVIVDWLWEKMDDAENIVTCVDLLQQMHSAIPDLVDDRIEGFLLNSLTNSSASDIKQVQLFTFSKFATFWHIGRENHAKLGTSLSMSDIFCKCMLKMLDQLRTEENDLLRIEIQNWLVHSLVRGDIYRILDPLLLMLLDSSTARLSILHIRLNEPALPDSKISAISSVNGNIVYHTGRRPSGGGRRPKRVQAITSLQSDNKTVTEKTENDHISLYVNPLSSSKALSTDFDDYFEETDKQKELDNLKGKGDMKNGVSSKSCSQLDQEAGRVGRLTGALFTRVSDGESEPLSEGWELVRSWSFPGKATLASQEFLEESTPADEYFSSSSNNDSPAAVIDDIIADLLDRVAILSGDLEESSNGGKGIRHLQYQSTITSGTSNIEHLHSHLLLYTSVYDGKHILYTLHTLINMLTINPRVFLCAACTTPLVSRSKILTLVGHHKKSLFGRGFGGFNDISFKNVMYLEVLIMTCLYFMRSYFLPGMTTVSLNNIICNCQVQVTSCELVEGLVQELIGLVRCSGTGLSCYIADLFSKLKVHKIVLHSALTALSQHRTAGSSDFTAAILTHNDPQPRTPDSLSHHIEALQTQLSRLLLSLIILEYEVNLRTSEEPVQTEKPGDGCELRYINGKLIPQQPLFIAILNRALENEAEMRPTQTHWTSLATSSLHYLGSATTWVATTIIRHICKNIESVSLCYASNASKSFPADYGITQLEAMTVLCHYCLLDTSTPFKNSPSTSLPNTASSHVFTNLAHLFVSSSYQLAKADSKEKLDWQVTARKAVLGFLPRIIASVSVLWQAVTSTKDRESDNCAVGSPKVVRQLILDLLSPIAKHHSTSFLAAMAVVWRERKLPIQTTPQNMVSMPTANEGQIVLVQLLIGIKALPMDALVHTIHQVVKQPSNNEEIGVEVSALELFVQYISQTGSCVADSWSKLYVLLRDGPLFSPPAQFLLLGLLAHFVHKCPPLQDKKDLKDLQDITAKLVECLTSVAGACLEQTTWLRRNLAVREEEPPPNSPDKEDKSGSSVAGYSVAALTIMAQLLAPLLDVVFGSQEKERVVTLLTNLMYNVTPYLRNHTVRNGNSFYACSQLLASFSGYQYTRKAWKKDAMELLLDSSFFQMEPRAVPYWKTIIDNLVSQDAATFRELIARVSMAQGNGLNIFSSREQEYEQKAQLLKRLAFVILCSEKDQFQKHMPEIQERLAEVVRLPQLVPSVQSQVMLCFRVLLLRMSQSHCIPLWPNIVSEMVQVLLHMEVNLSTDSEDFSSHIGASMEWGLSNGVSNNHPQWLQLQLATAHLLFLCVQLPPDSLPQFQMYRWAFVGTDTYNKSQGTADFIPHVTRISRLMDAKFGVVEALPVPLLPHGGAVRTVEDLHPFFSAMSSGRYTQLSLSQLEHNIELDFLDSMPSK